MYGFLEMDCSLPILLYISVPEQAALAHVLLEAMQIPCNHFVETPPAQEVLFLLTLGFVGNAK